MRGTVRRMVAAIAASAMIVSFLTGCGNKGTNGEKTSVTTQIPSTTAVTTTAEVTTEATTIVDQVTTQATTIEEQTTTQATTVEEQTTTVEATKTPETKKTSANNSRVGGNSGSKTVQLNNRQITTQGTTKKPETVTTKKPETVTTTTKTPETTTASETTTTTAVESTTTSETTTTTAVESTTTSASSTTTSETTTTTASETTTTTEEPSTSVTTSVETTVTTTVGETTTRILNDYHEFDFGEDQVYIDEYKDVVHNFIANGMIKFVDALKTISLPYNGEEIELAAPDRFIVDHQNSIARKGQYSFYLISDKRIQKVDCTNCETEEVKTVDYQPSNNTYAMVDCFGRGKPQMLLDIETIRAFAKVSVAPEDKVDTETRPCSYYYDENWELQRIDGTPLFENETSTSDVITSASTEESVNIDNSEDATASKDEPKDLVESTDIQSETATTPEANDDSNSNVQKEEDDVKNEEPVELEELINNSTTTD